MSNEKLNLQPLQELLTCEIELDSLINHLDHIYFNFTELCLKMSCIEGNPIEKETIVNCYWIARLKQVFEESRNFKNIS